MSKRVVEVKRRRRTEPSEPGERERAEAPRRRRSEDSGVAAGTTGRQASSRPSDSVPQIPIGGLLQLLGGGKLSLPMIIGILSILGICACLYIFVLSPSGPGDEYALPAATQAAVVAQATNLPAPTRTPRSFTPPAVSSEGGQTWLVMLYQDADDKVLEQDLCVDLNEAERVGSND
jgi:hypothetical protein